MVSNRLRNAVIQVLHVACSNFDIRGHGSRADADIELDVIAAAIVILQVRKHARLLCGQCNLEGCESLWGDNPRRDCASKVLGVEGSEGNVLPHLHITGTPVVEQAVTEDVISGLANRDRLAHIVTLANKRAHLKLEVHALTVRPSRYLPVRGNLTLGTSDIRARDYNGGGPTVVANR